MYEMLLAVSMFGTPGKYAMAPAPLVKYETARTSSKTYDDAKAEAAATKVPLIVFVGVALKDVPGAVTCRVESLDEGRITNAIVVAVPNDAVGLEWKSTLSGDAPDSAIRRAAGLWAARAASPFSSSQRRERTADDERILRQLPFLADLEPYDTAQRVQYSHRRDTGFISSYPRSHAEPKWNAAGGLLGVTGWTSALYKKASASVGLGYVDEAVVFSPIVWQPKYEDGSVFADVLRNDRGRVFEVRVAEKQGGAWDRYVAYRNPSEYPAGYVPIKRSSCVACHSEAGNTLYGGKPAVPGGDTVISDPIPQVESGETYQDGRGLKL